MSGERSITLQRREGVTGNGDHVFRREGVKASIYCTPRMFRRGQLPDSITITCTDDVFRLPGNLDPEATQRRIALLEERALKKRTRAQTDLSAADEIDILADALQASLERLPLSGARHE